MNIYKEYSENLYIINIPVDDVNKLVLHDETLSLSDIPRQMYRFLAGGVEMITLFPMLTGGSDVKCTIQPGYGRYTKFDNPEVFLKISRRLNKSFETEKIKLLYVTWFYNKPNDYIDITHKIHEPMRDMLLDGLSITECSVLGIDDLKLARELSKDGNK